MGIEVEGLANVDRGLGQIDKELRRGLRSGLRLAAEPVAGIAQQVSLRQISGMSRERTVKWSEFRIGGGLVVFVAPGRRGRGSDEKRRRPNLARLMLNSMETAARIGSPGVEHAVERVVEDSISKAGF